VKNLVREKLAAGKPVFGTMIQELRSPAVPILYANIGYDFVFIDMEHGAYSMETVADMIKVCRGVGITPFVRVPDLQYHFIARCLDAGVQGFMVPRVATRQDAEKAVAYSKYPPLGERGCSVNKGHNDYKSGDMLKFIKEANEENFVMLQIERKSAMENLDDMLSVKGIDAAILGPNDMAASYGVSEDLNGQFLNDIFQKVLEAGKRHGVYTGMHIANLPKLVEWKNKGMQIITYSTDLGFLTSGAQAGLKELTKTE
jgi:2-dehydro-3-deoxyglucarate aldolase/4-hydroxy-2-oxoheptanedioate aldolase